MTNVLLVDDQTIVVMGIAKLLEATGKARVVGQLSGASECLEFLENEPAPDLILLDVHMPERNGLELIRDINARWDIPVVFLTTFDDDYLRQQAIDAGAKGLLLKSVTLEELTNAIDLAAQGRSLFPAEKRCPTDGMTEREDRLARLLVEGKTNKEIAAEQSLSPGTVRNYLSRLFEKLEVRNRSEAVVRLKELGLF